MTDDDLDRTYTLLQQLKPNCFEKLVGLLLEKLTGMRFFQARSGSQSGRDLASYSQGVLLQVEAKRYSESSGLKKRDLLGGLSEALRTKPDLWCLSATCEVPEQIVDALREATSEKGVDLLILDRRERFLSEFSCLVAFGEDFLSDFLKEPLPDELGQELESVRRSPDFTDRLDSLKEMLFAPTVGLQQWRRCNNAEIASLFQDAKRSDNLFLQKIDIGDSNFVKRTEISNALCREFSNPSASRHLVLTGEEGDGKTWCAASWITDQIKGGDEKAFIAVTPNLLTSAKPAKLFADIASEMFSSVNVHWDLRFKRWLEDEKQVFLVFLDDLKDTEEIRSEVLMKKLTLKENIQVLSTCRAVVWKNYFEQWEDLGWRTEDVPPFNERELRQALKLYSIDPDSLSPRLKEVLKKPRYLELAVKHREKLEAAEDFTIARLIYEDWRDRLRKRAGEGSLGLSHEKFNLFIKECAKNVLEKEIDDDIIASRDTEEALPYIKSPKDAIITLINEGILIEDNRGFKVSEAHLALGFGLLLADTAKLAAIKSPASVEDEISKQLEPHPEMELKGAICEQACLLAMYQKDFPSPAKLALLRTWLSNHNYESKEQSSIAAYLAEAPEIYAQLAEEVWIKGGNPRARDILKHGLLKLPCSPKIEIGLKFLVDRWISILVTKGSPQAFSYARMKAEREGTKIEERLQQGILDRLNEEELEPGYLEIEGLSIRLTDERELFGLSQFSLVLLDRLSEPSEIAEFILRWGVSRGGNGQFDDQQLADWQIKRLYEKIEPFLLPRCNALIQSGYPSVRDGVVNILRACQTRQSEAILQAVEIPKPKIFSWGGPLIRLASQSSSMKNKTLEAEAEKFVLERVEKLKFEQIAKAPGQTTDDHDLESLLPILARYFPEKGVQLLRRLAATILTRPVEAIRRGVFFLEDHCPALHEPELRDQIFKLWESCRPNVSSTPEKLNDYGWLEVYFSTHILYGEEAIVQQEFLLKRPLEGCFSLRQLELLAPLDQPTLNKLSDVAASQDTIQSKRAYLCFLSFRLVEKLALDDTFIDRIIKATRSSEDYIRLWALRVLLRLGKKSSLRILAEQPLPASEDNCERHTRGLVLAQVADTLSKDELKKIPLSAMNTALRNRGGQKDEVQLFATAIDLFLHQNGDVSLRNAFEVKPNNYPWPYPPSLDIDHNAREQDTDYKGWRTFDDLEVEINNFRRDVKELVTAELEAGNPWYGGYWPLRGAEIITEILPQKTEEWTSLAFSDERLIHRYPALFEGICCDLLRGGSTELGESLFRLLQRTNYTRTVDSRTRLPVITHELLSMPESDSVRTMVRAEIELCKSDLELRRLAVAAAIENSANFKSEVQSLIGSDKRVDIARGIVLMAVFDEQIPSLDGHEDDLWIQDISERFKTDLQQWIDSRSWLELYLESTREEDAWVNFTLFLNSVDSRLYIWGARNKPDLGSLRHRYLLLMQESIKKKITKNEKGLENIFIGEPKLRDPVWPWQ